MLALFHGGETVQWITLLRTGTNAIVRNLEIAVVATPELQKDPRWNPAWLTVEQWQSVEACGLPQAVEPSP